MVVVKRDRSGCASARFSTPTSATSRPSGGHRVLIITRKGAKKATIPMAPRTAEAVDAYVGKRVTGSLFITATGRDGSGGVENALRLARVAVPGKVTTIQPRPQARVRDVTGATVAELTNAPSRAYQPHRSPSLPARDVAPRPGDRRSPSRTGLLGKCRPYWCARWTRDNRNRGRREVNKTGQFTCKNVSLRGRSSMVESQPSKLVMRVRFPSPALLTDPPPPRSEIRNGRS